MARQQVYHTTTRSTHSKAAPIKAATTTVTVSTCDSVSFDSAIAIYDGGVAPGVCPDVTLDSSIACNDDDDLGGCYSVSSERSDSESDYYSDDGSEYSAESEEQRNTRSISLRDLESADERINEERETYAKTARRIEMLMEDLTNQATAIQSKEANIMAMLEKEKKGEGVDDIPEEQVAHWNSRDPEKAAADFILLYKKSPGVAVTLVRKMKKKKSAKLIDSVATLGTDGKEVASLLHEAIGTGVVKDVN